MRGRARKRWLLAGAVSAALVVAVGTVLFLFRDRATPVERGEVGATLVTSGGRPGDFGLYVYATTGFETTDALSGSRHNYPAQTYMTIQPGGCGTLVRWQALGERWDEWDYCADGSLAGWQAYHEWFGVSNLEVWTCSPPVPTQGGPGGAWTGSCTRVAGSQVDAAEDSLRYEVVGYETLTVGSEQVETLRVRTRSSSSGGSDSTDATDTWVLPGTQLVVRQVTDDSSTSQSRIGPVEYHEEYELHLVSLYPSS
ncbi:MAG: hypothetical protein ABIJ48_00955 [Actinomycetota bacterium]